MLYSLNHYPTCRFEVRQALIYQLVSGLTDENGKYNYAKAVHHYPPFFDISCSAKNYKIASALTVTVSQRGTRSESAAAVPVFCRLEGAGLLPPKTNHTGARWPLAGGLQFSRRPVAAFFPAFFWEPVGGTVSQVLAGYSYPRGQKIFGGL